MQKAIGLIVILMIIVGGAFFIFSNNQQSSNSPTNTQKSSTSTKIEGYQGQVLAGSTSPFLVYSKADYEKAKSEGKIIVLNFYANWCPICRAEEPEIFAAFDELNNSQVVGFRVNFNDPDTDSDEKALASEFNIPYQHTKLVLKNGQEVSRHPNQIKKVELLQVINEAL